MKLIDADQLCEDLLNRWSIADTKKEELIRQVMADVVTPIVVSQPTVETQKWIPCSERLPNEYERMETYSHPDRASSFIVTIKGAIIPTVLYLTDDNYWKDENGHYYSVSAWMELPEVYREGNDEIN